MSQEAPRAGDDAATLMARVDELTAVMAALGRVLERGTTTPPSRRPDRLTEQQIIDGLDGIAAEIDDLRGWVAMLQERADAAEGALQAALDAADEARQDVDRIRLSATEWEQEAARLAAHRDEVVAELLQVQGSRWMNLGRSLRLVRDR
jgi:hypothetical protein